MPGPDALKEKPGQSPQGAKLVKRLVNSLQSVSSFSEEMQARCMVPCTEVWCLTYRPYVIRLVFTKKLPASLASSRWKPSGTMTVSTALAEPHDPVLPLMSKVDGFNGLLNSASLP